jgi:hypothetical protein
MSLLRTLPTVAAACGLTLFAVAAAGAQDAPSPPAASAAQNPQAAQRFAMMREHMEHRRAEHLHLLHDALAIRSDQEGAWQAFAAATTPEHKAGEHHWGPEGKGGEHHELTTPERLDRMQARLAERTAAFQRHAAAVKTLYAALTPTQQHTFDALSRLHGGMHGGFGRGGMGGHMHGQG